MLLDVWQHHTSQCPMALPQVKLPEGVKAFVKACPALEHEVLADYTEGLLHLSRSMELLARTEVSLKICQLAVQVSFFIGPANLQNDPADDVKCQINCHREQLKHVTQLPIRAGPLLHSFCKDQNFVYDLASSYVRLEIAGAESRVESRAPLFVFISVESEKISRPRHCPCEVFALFMANGKTVRSDSLTHCRVVDDCDRLAAKRPEIQVDDGRATGQSGEVVAPVHHNVPSRICAR